MQKNIIKINEKLCTGCWSCLIKCPQSASDHGNPATKRARGTENPCYNLGVCPGACPNGALSIIKAEIPERSCHPGSSRQLPSRKDDYRISPFGNLVKNLQACYSGSCSHLRKETKPLAEKNYSN